MKTRTRGLLTSLFLMAACISVGQSHLAQVGDSQISSQNAPSSPNDEKAPKLWISIDYQHIIISEFITSFFGIGVGSSFSGQFQFNILDKGKLGLHGVLGAGIANLKYDGPLYLGFLNRSFDARELSLSITTGVILSIRNPRDKMEHLNLEASGMVSFYNRDYWELPSYQHFNKTGEKFLIFLSPMYSRGLERIRFSTGPFANFVISEKKDNNTQTFRYYFGMRMVFGLGL